MEQNICQSCGMPLEKEEDFGTNSNGSKSEEYCFHCFQNGTFLARAYEGITLQEKIEKNVKFAVQIGCLRLKQGKWHQTYYLT